MYVVCATYYIVGCKFKLMLMRNRFIIIAVLITIVFYGCNKETTDDGWVINESVKTYLLEYDSKMNLTKYSEFINDTLHLYFTYEYSDSQLVEKQFDHNSDQVQIIKYVLDLNNRVVKSYSSFENHSIDTIIYSPSGFLSKILINQDNLTFHYNDNGSDIISAAVEDYSSTIELAQELSILQLPNDYFMMPVPIYIGMFGKLNRHLAVKYSSYVGLGTTREYEFEYSFNHDDLVTELKQRKTHYNHSVPIEKTISYFKYEYVFE